MGTSRKTPTRRGLLQAGLAVGAVALLPAAAAYASDDHDDDDNGRGKGNGNDNGRGPRPIPAPARFTTFSSDLVTVSQSASSGDFTSGNAGGDPLTDGRITLVRPRDGGEGRAEVVLRGAAANVSYDVFFQPFNTGKGREGLGTIGPTNGSGNLNDRAPNVLSGTNRVGMFIIARTGDGSGQAGKDEFVSSVGG